MIFKRKIILTVLALILLVLCGCTVSKKLSAADILLKTTLEFESMTLDSVEINKDLFPQKGLGSLLPNPQVIAMVQDFARGILEKEIGRAHLSVNVVAKNGGQDTLWIKKLTAVVKLDSLMSLPVDLKDSIKLVPGENHITVATYMPLDRRLFKLGDVNAFNLVGRLDVSLTEDDSTVPLEFDMNKTITQEEKVELADKARTSVLNGIVNDWVGAILPNN